MRHILSSGMLTCQLTLQTEARETRELASCHGLRGLPGLLGDQTNQIDKSNQMSRIILFRQSRKAIP
jgi:hypothetical protein